MNHRLRNARDQAGKSQLDVAFEANISERSYQRIEYGQQNPVVTTANLIARSVGKTSEYLFPARQDIPRKEATPS